MISGMQIDCLMVTTAGGVWQCSNPMACYVSFPKKKKNRCKLILKRPNLLFKAYAVILYNAAVSYTASCFLYGNKMRFLFNAQHCSYMTSR